MSRGVGVSSVTVASSAGVVATFSSDGLVGWRGRPRTYRLPSNPPSPSLFVAVTVMVPEPAAVGVPLRTRVVMSNARPAG